MSVGITLTEVRETADPNRAKRRRFWVILINTQEHDGIPCSPADRPIAVD